MAAPNPPLLSVVPDDEFIGRRREIDRIYQMGMEAAGSRRHSTLLVGRRGIGKSEVLRRAYNRLFWNQSRVVPLCLTLTKETTDVVAFARQWLATFLRQFLGFQRRDADLINDDAMPHGRALRLAHEAGDQWLIQLVENFEESLRDEDWVSLLRNSVGAPLLTVRTRHVPVFTIVDEFQRIGRLDLAGAPISLAGQFEFILQGEQAPHLLAGSSLRVIERLLGANLLGRHIDRMRIEPLPGRPALRLWEHLCTRHDVDHDRKLGLEVVEQLEGVPLYIHALVRAAAKRGVSLTSLRNMEMVYADDLMNGEIGALWGALFEEAIPDVGDRRGAMALLHRLTDDANLAPVSWRRLVRAVEVEESQLQSVAERLERGGFLEIGHSQVYPAADLVLRDWVRLAHAREERGEETSALRQDLVRERLLWVAQVRQERSQRQLGLKVEALLDQWDCQSLAPILLDWPAFHREHGGKIFQEAADAVEGAEPSLPLPQVVGVSAAADAPADAPTLLAYGFEDRKYAQGAECLVVTQILRGGELVTATRAEAFVALARGHAARLGIENLRPWLIARGGFTDEAAEALAEADCWTSDFTQLQLMMRHFGVKTEEAVASRTRTVGVHEALLTGEYALSIPMQTDTELVAASAIDQIAAQAGFPEAARGQVKMAVIEACINAREHSGETGVITLLIRPADTNLEIVVENPGQAFDPEGVPEPVIEEKMGKGRSLRDKRGFGLKLMRNLMDEVVFEPCDDGMRVRLVKYRPPSAKTPSPDVVDISPD